MVPYKYMNMPTKGIFAVLAYVFLISLMSVLPRYLEAHFTVFQQVYLRLGLALILSVVLFRNHLSVRELMKVSSRELSLAFARGVVYYGLGVVLATKALLLTKIANVAFIQVLPITAILGFTLMGERKTLVKLFFVGVSLWGTMLLFAGKTSFDTLGVGEWYALAAAFCFALSSVTRRWHSGALSDVQMSVLMLASGTATVMAFSAFAGEGVPVAGWSWESVFFVILAALVNVGGGYTMSYGFNKVSAVASGTLFTLSAPLSLLYGIVLFNETLTASELWGGLLIMLSAILMMRYAGSHK